MRRKSSVFSMLRHPIIRLLLIAIAIALIILVCVSLTRLMPIMDSTESNTPLPLLVTATPSPIPTLSPKPTITPTPAVVAPFGAQYGYGGAELLPDTPRPTATPYPTASLAPVSATSRPVLRKGSNGSSVKKLQEALISLGYLSGSADGEFGNNTHQAVVQFQAVNGLTADGIAGEKTQLRLFSTDAIPADQAPEMDYLVLVNRDHRLEKNTVPTDLVKIADLIPPSILKVKYADTRANRTATEALRTMLEAAVQEGITDWQVSSAYRSYSEQQELVDQSVAKFRANNPNWSKERCLSATYQTVAPAGASEHMTGLAFDITVPGISFSGTTQQKWLHAHCAEYGFVVRFPEDKQKITGFLAESWHFRYVGIPAAQTMTQNNWVLEEYVEKMGISSP